MVGRRLLHYEVVEKLGEGGMGVVYKARDTHLERFVAIKILPPDKTADPERKKRFVQEARAASALNHPNIVVVYDITSDNGIDFIVMEYVAGKGLDQLIPRKGFSPPRVLKYAVQIASALAKAHLAGIVHRDLKPANIMVSPDDHVKLLDFGLAKLTENLSAASNRAQAASDEAAGSWQDASTRLTGNWRPHTEPGIIVGTVCFMSPEQAEGKPVDNRSDIFSFGAVMYEMISGRRAFERETNAATIAAILRDEPKPVSTLVPEVPQELERAVTRCLRKDPERRYQTMADLRVALEDLKQDSDSGKLSTAGPVSAVASKSFGRRASYIGAGVLVVAAGALGLFWRFGKKDPVPTAPEVRRLTFDSKLALHPSISPDGRYVAYASDRAGEGNLDIWVQALPTGEPVRLTKDEANEDLPCFSSDATKIAFRSEREGGGVYTVPVLGGEPRLLARGWSFPRYSPDGQFLLVAYPNSDGDDLGGVQDAEVMPAEGGEPRAISLEPGSVGIPVWSPDARRFLFRERLFPEPGGSWHTVPVSTGPRVLVQPSAQSARIVDHSLPLAWLSDDRVLFSIGPGDATDLSSTETANLWVAKLSPDSRRILGQPEQLTFGPSHITQASVSAGGATVFASTTASSRLWNIPLGAVETRDKGEPPATIAETEFDYWPSLSDTGDVAYLSRRLDNWDVRLRHLSSGKDTALASTHGGGFELSAMINRAGTSVAYSDNNREKSAIYVIESRGELPKSSAKAVVS